ncbi:hypothetical protein B0H15DRAFT_87849 [Mycena belliarum]|uniref:Uncharacterized protein n=1 Tax=Mycena belliarum TaxID=1033014 RepID=A0AAD6TSK0_9AGAR|nr:hypothetical protein B0H15DRAFT_87849 [Mycena belliae]
MASTSTSCPADRFSFTACPHTSSHGFHPDSNACTTTAEPHEYQSPHESRTHENEIYNENQPEKHRSSAVYPSPPPTADEPRRSVPLPLQKQGQEQHGGTRFGGILDSPVVFLRTGPAPATGTWTWTGAAAVPLSPPPTLPTQTTALPPSPVLSLLEPIEEDDLQPIEEDELQDVAEQPQPESQLLSPISPEWTTHSSESGDGGALEEDCVLMAQPAFTRYNPSFARHAPADVQDDDVLHGCGVAEDDVANALGFERPALAPLDIPNPMQNLEHPGTHDEESEQGKRDDIYTGAPLGFSGVQSMEEERYTDAPLRFMSYRPATADISIYQDRGLLGFPGKQLIDETMDVSHELMSPFFSSPSSSSSSSPLDDLDELYSDDDTKMHVDEWDSYAPTPLRSFASLPAPELDELGLDTDLGPGFGESPSPSRWCASPLPAFTSHDECDEAFPMPLPDEPPSPYGGGSDSSMSQIPPPSPSRGNALLLDLPPAPPSAAPAPSPLDAYSADELAARLPPGIPPTELDALLALRARAADALAQAVADAASGAGATNADMCGGTLEYELRRHAPRDAGEPRRRRKRAKEVGREVEALLGLVLGVLPPCPSASASSSSSRAPSSPGPSTSSALAEEKREKKLRGEKAGLAGLASVPALVARMILRRRERAVRGIGESRARAGNRGALLSPCPLDEDAEPPPPIGVEGSPLPMKRLSPLMDLDAD